MQELKDERSAILEAASTNERVLHSQTNRIKETIHRMLEKDATLRDKIKTLFREQGVCNSSQHIDADSSGDQYYCHFDRCERKTHSNTSATYSTHAGSSGVKD